jgi:putative transposase
VVTIVTDNGSPFRSFAFAACIAAHPEPAHVRTRVKSPGQNGSRERGSAPRKYERLSIDKVDDARAPAGHTRGHRTEDDPTRPHEAIAWNRPQDRHLGLAAPTNPTLDQDQIPPST